MKYWACGKLLISAEYTILRGAKGLSLPTKFGQQLEVNLIDTGFLYWKSVDEVGNVWFEATFASDFSCVQTSDPSVSDYLIKILKTAITLNPAFNPFGTKAKTTLEFNPEWGLGSSSTLIALIANWAKVDALKLFSQTSTGSGYDVATAVANTPILYSIVEGKANVQSTTFDPPFKNSLFFLYLGKKQRSHAEVVAFEKTTVSNNSLELISSLTEQILNCKELSHFEELTSEHEEITSSILNTPTIKTQLFSKYPHAIKSLGAWGGDFVMLACPSGDLSYFRKMGFPTILSWQEMFGE